MLLVKVQQAPTKVRKATLRRREFAWVFGRFLNEQRSDNSLAYARETTECQLTFKRDQKKNGQVDIDDGIESDKRNHRDALHADEALSVYNSGNATSTVRKPLVNESQCQEDLLDKVEDDNHSITTKKCDHIEQVKFRISSSCSRASNNMLDTIRNFTPMLKKHMELTAFSTRKTYISYCRISQPFHSTVDRRAHNLGCDIAYQAKQNSAMANVKAAVDTEDLLEDCRGENKTVGVDVDDQNDYIIRLAKKLNRILASVQETYAKQQMVTWTRI